MLKSGVRSIMSLFSRRKKLVVSGCSYTDNYARQEKIKEFPLWGELLAEKLDMDLINLGRCGYGNKALVGGKNASLGELFRLSKQLNFN